MGAAYYDPSDGVLYVMEDIVDARGRFETISMLLEQIIPEVILLSSNAEDSLVSSIEKAGQLVKVLTQREFENV